MVAAAALGDVVEEAGEKQRLLVLEVGDEPRAERIFVRMLRFGEPAQVPDHHQDVLVHRVDVEEVVLHLPDDAAQHRQVLAENAEQVHPAQLVRKATGLAEDLHEARAVAGVAPECDVDPAPLAPQRPQRPRAHPDQLGRALQHQEGVEHRRRTPREQVLVAHVQQLVDALPLVVDRHRRRRGGVEARMDVLQQDDVDLPHQLGGAVIALHQLLARAARRRVGEAQLARERRLQVEHQAILAAIREVVQPYAQAADEALVPRHGARFRHRHQIVPRELAPAAAVACRARDPQDRLEITQAAGALLDVRLEVVRRVVILEVALLLLQRLRLVERARIERLREKAAELLRQPPRARQVAVLEEARAHGHVGRHLARAFLDRAHGVRELEADVPERGEEALERRGPGRVRRARQQHQDVDVRVRVELPASVAADGEQGVRGGHARLGPDADDRAVDQARMLAQKARCVGIVEERVLERLASPRELVAPEQHARPPVRRRRRGHGRGGRRVDAGRAGHDDSGGGGGVPADWVRISNPSSVTSTVCSHCADSE